MEPYLINDFIDVIFSFIPCLPHVSERRHHFFLSILPYMHDQSHSMFNYHPRDLPCWFIEDEVNMILGYYAMRRV